MVTDRLIDGRDRSRALSLDADGAQLFPAALDEAVVKRVEDALVHLPSRPGARLYGGCDSIADLLAPSGAIGRIATAEQGSSTGPVRVILFDKSDSMNWSLGFHQDRTIAVETRRAVAGFGPWSIKAGQLHVQPPQSIIDGMMTLRIHLDDVDADNAPLDVLSGSHLHGRLDDDAVTALAETSQPFACLARRGDIWAYRTPIVHGSRSVRIAGGRRRVLQIDYSADRLPGGLAWALAP